MKLQIFSVVFFALLLSACGGGGGSSSSSSSSSTPDNVSLDDTPGDDAPGDDTPGDDTPGDDTPGDDENSFVSKDGNFDISVIWALGQSFPADPTRTFIDLYEVAVNPNGQMALYGSLNPPDKVGFEAVIGGSPESLDYVISDGDSFANQPSTIKFKSARSLKMTSDGYVGFVARIDGAVEGQGYALQTENGVELIAFTDGTSITGLDGVEYPVTTINDGYPSTSAVALRTRGGLSAGINSDILSLWKDGESTAILHQGQVTIPRPVTNDGCEIYLPLATAAPFFVRDNGDLYFIAERGSGNNCEASYSLIRYRDGEYETIVTGGQKAPGFPNEELVGVHMLQFDPDVGITFYSLISADASNFYRRDEIGTIWFYNFDGTFELLAVEGQGFDYPIGSGLVPGISHISEYDVNFSAKEWTIGLPAGTTGYAALGGTMEQDDNITDLRNPSPLSLRQLITKADTVSGFDSDNVHNSFTNLEAIGGDRFFLSTEVGNSGSRFTASTRWFMSGTTLTELYRENDIITFAGDDYIIGQTFGNPINGRGVYSPSEKGRTAVTNDGSIFSTADLRASGARRVGNGLLMLKPRNQ